MRVSTYYKLVKIYLIISEYKKNDNWTRQMRYCIGGVDVLYINHKVS